MEIYFSGSVSGGRKDVAIYARLIEHLKNHGNVLTEHLGDANLQRMEGKSNSYIFGRDIDWLIRSDAVVAEVSTPSSGVGYEIGIAESLHKPILCLYKKEEGDRGVSGMILGNRKLTVREYSSIDEAFGHIDKFFASLKRP